MNTRVQRQWDTFAEPHLEFWCHSAAAGACFRIELLSDNPATPALDGYALPVTVDWKGWKRLRLPISAFAAAGRPAGTGEIGAVRLTVRAPGCLVPRDTALCFDDMWLCERKGQFARPPAPGDVDAWAQSPAFDVANWKGMQPETKTTLPGAPAGRWANPGVNSAVWGGDVPADWSRYSDLEMWIYAEGVRGLPIEFSAQSDSPATPETDDYRRYLIVDWDGWRLVRLARWQFDTYKSPLGWNQVQSFSIRNLAAVWGYTPATVRPEGFLCLEGVRLSNRSGGLALDTAGLSVAAEGAGGGATFLLPYRQTNLGEKPVAFTLAVMEKADLGRLRIEPAGTPPLPGLAAQAGKVTVSITAQDLAQPRGFFREAQVVTTPAHGPQALTAVPFSLEPLYYRALDLLHLPVPETLVVEAFEEGPYRWSGLLPDTAVVHGGKQSALWENAGHRGIVYCNSLPHDWSRYDTLSFWLHSETATGQRFDFCAFSDNRNTPAQDYWYVKDYRVDWTGWKQFTLRLEEMDNIRDPVSWGQIDRIGFFTGWFANEPTDGTMLRLDDIVLTRGKGAQ